MIRNLVQYKRNAAMKIHRKESQPHFSEFCLTFIVSLMARCMKWICKIYYVYIIYLFLIVYGVFQLDFKGLYYNIRMRLGNAMLVFDLYGLFLYSGHFSV